MFDISSNGITLVSMIDWLYLLQLSFNISQSFQLLIKTVLSHQNIDVGVHLSAYLVIMHSFTPKVKYKSGTEDGLLQKGKKKKVQAFSFDFLLIFSRKIQFQILQGLLMLIQFCLCHEEAIKKMKRKRSESSLFENKDSRTNIIQRSCFYAKLWEFTCHSIIFKVIFKLVE